MTHQLPNDTNDDTTFNYYQMIGQKEWDHNEVTFYYNHNGCPFSLADVELVIADVVSYLNRFTHLTYVYGGTTTNLPNTHVGGKDNIVAIGWADLTGVGMGMGTSLAVTRNFVGFDWIDDSGMAFNTAYSGWNPTNNPNYLTCFEHTLLHELGHVAGIGHGQYSNVVMLGGGAILNAPGPMALHPCDLIAFDYKYPNIAFPKRIFSDPVCINYPAGDPRKDMLGARDVYIPVLQIDGNPDLACAKLSYLEPTQETPSHMVDPVPVWRSKYILSYLSFLYDVFNTVDVSDYTYSNISDANNQTVWLQNVYVRRQWLSEAQFDRLSPTSNQWLLTSYTGM